MQNVSNASFMAVLAASRKICPENPEHQSQINEGNQRTSSKTVHPVVFLKTKKFVFTSNVRS